VSVQLCTCPWVRTVLSSAQWSDDEFIAINGPFLEFDSESGYRRQYFRRLSDGAPARKYAPALVAKKKKSYLMPATEVLCPHDAEEVEKILRGVRRTSGAAANPRPLEPMRGRSKSRLQVTTFTDSRRRCFLLSAEEREVVGGVVSELKEFGDLKGSKTAEQQSNQRSEDETGAHFRARR
jgi:hypothetical protein